MYKEIDPDLLRRYVDGKVTVSEKTEVEQWIKDTTFNSERTVFETQEEKKNIKKEIWYSLEKRSRLYFSKKTFCRINRRTLYTISSAACVAGIGIFLSVILSTNSTPLTYAGLKEKTVRFCQNTRLDVEENTQVTFIADCNNGKVLKQTILCEKGETYFAIKTGAETDGEIFVVTQRNLQELPRDIRIELHKDALL